ncbi:hypothetical protein [Prosthecochloris sp.]|uniref:hypothetical protein n=1 Tax=Prosthecochloris sp. TaxID=290513 RepID=UPI0025D6F32E|nr:hypothetical protein [Prosthecochloris sp.]
MNIDKKGIWQQAAGDTDRDYSGLCLQWGVILNGPAYAGPWPECRKALIEDGCSSKKLTDLRRFAEEILDGDIIVLRMGTSSVLAVGEVVGKYEWRPEFGDIDGWEIQHVRRVRWLWKSPKQPMVFATYALKQGDTTQRLDSKVVRGWLKNLTIPAKNYSLQLPDLPAIEDSKEISIPDISEFLFDHGVASDSIANLVAHIGELIRIAKWYQRNSMPSEHETVTYLVIPLLRALGWTPQRMAVEWNRVDVALFSKLPRDDNHLTIVVEAKKMNASCLSAMSQAQSYALGKTECHRLIVTDGLRYGVYTRNSSDTFMLSAYMNLTRLMSSYPIYPCAGAKEALLIMAPEWS